MIQERKAGAGRGLDRVVYLVAITTPAGINNGVEAHSLPTRGATLRDMGYRDMGTGDMGYRGKWVKEGVGLQKVMGYRRRR